MKFLLNEFIRYQIRIRYLILFLYLQYIFASNVLRYEKIYMKVSKIRFKSIFEKISAIKLDPVNSF